MITLLITVIIYTFYFIFYAIPVLLFSAIWFVIKLIILMVLNATYKKGD